MNTPTATATLAVLLLSVTCGLGDAARPVRTSATTNDGKAAGVATTDNGREDDRDTVYDIGSGSGDGYESQRQPQHSNAHQMPPSTFRLDDAFRFYRIESRTLMKQSLLLAGFPEPDTHDESYLDLYLDFSITALTNEKRRMESILETLEEEMNPLESANVGTQQNTCSDASGECGANDNKPAAAEALTAKDARLSPDFGHFLPSNLKPGQVDVLRWSDSGRIVQAFGARVGLPPQFLSTITAYAKDMGLLDIMTNMLYDDPLPPDGARWFSFRSPYQEEADAGKLRNFTWNVERPAKKWKSDMHWFNTADELSHEDALRALAKGGFDKVLEGIGKEFGLETLHVDSFGFVAVTACERGFIHTDWEDVQGKAHGSTSEMSFVCSVHSQ